MDEKKVVEDGATDAGLLRRIARGDATAEEGLFNKYAKLARAVGMRFRLSEADAKELAADVLLDTIEQARQGRLRDPVRPWLVRVASNRAIDWKRAAAIRTKQEKEAADEFLLGLVSRGDDGTVVSYPKVAVRRALHRLRERDRQRQIGDPSDGDADIIVWIGHGASNQDLASYLGITENNARQRRKRALDRFKAALGDIYEDRVHPGSSEHYEEL